MTMTPSAGTHLQYAGRINCAAQGCQVPCKDNGTIYFFGDQRIEVMQGHVVDVLLRTVNFAPWIEVDAA